MGLNENILRKIKEETEGSEELRNFLVEALKFEATNPNPRGNYEKKYESLLAQAKKGVVK